MPDKLQMTRKGDRDLVFTRRFNAPRELVFAAHTTPALIKRWLLGPPGWSMPVCDFQPVAGSRNRYVWRNNDSGEEFGLSGMILEIDPPKRLVWTELFDGQELGSDATSTAEFTDEGGVTLMVLTVSYPTEKICNDMIATGMTEGMDASYGLLDELLETQKT